MKWMMFLRIAVLAGLVIAFMPASEVYAGTVCTLVAHADTGSIITEEGDCGTRVTPASTFKLPLAIIGFDARILTSPDTPAIDYDPAKHVGWMENWKTTVTPRTWLRDSVVWYSWTITQRLGSARLAAYLARLDYGNQDLSGHPDKDDGLTHAWLSSSLTISPREQAAFLRKLVMRSLPVKVSSQELAVETTASYAFGNGQRARGKTGTGSQPGPDGGTGHQIGWFIGWTDGQDNPVVFVRLIRDMEPQDTYASIRARDTMLADLPGYLVAASGSLRR